MTLSKTIISTGAKRTVRARHKPVILSNAGEIVSSTVAQRTMSVHHKPLILSNAGEVVISTGAQRSGETPAFVSLSSQPKRWVPHIWQPYRQMWALQTPHPNHQRSRR